MLDYRSIHGYDIKEVLRLLHDTYDYQNKGMLDTCICHIYPRKVILLKSTAKHAIVVHDVYVYDSNMIMHS